MTLRQLEKKYATAKRIVSRCAAASMEPPAWVRHILKGRPA